MYFTVYRTMQLICWERITLLASRRLKTVNTHQSAANGSTTIWWNPATCTSQRFSCNLSFIACSEMSNNIRSICPDRETQRSCKGNPRPENSGCLLASIWLHNAHAYPFWGISQIHDSQEYPWCVIYICRWVNCQLIVSIAADPLAATHNQPQVYTLHEHSPRIISRVPI